MLTDIFARRYLEARIWEFFTEEPRRLLVQGLQLLNDLCPYYIDGKEYAHGQQYWRRLHDLLARELGLKELHPRYQGYYNKQNVWQSFANTYYSMCEHWLLEDFKGQLSADRFIKERLSLIEIGFREQEATVAEANRRLAQSIVEAEQFDSARQQSRSIAALFAQSDTHANNARKFNASLNAKFQAAVTELNMRFRQANCPLHYHNGFIQISADETVAAEVETPFWKLVSDAKWANVDTDMKEAIDRRDSGDRDPAVYAARALESSIKIISDDKQLTKGNERGAANYIDNLRGAKLIEVWEMETLKHYFSKVRNPFSHGPGSAPMLVLTEHQTNWAIEYAMIWIRSLIRRV